MNPHKAVWIYNPLIIQKIVQIKINLPELFKIINLWQTSLSGNGIVTIWIKDKSWYSMNYNIHPINYRIGSQYNLHFYNCKNVLNRSPCTLKSFSSSISLRCVLPPVWRASKVMLSFGNVHKSCDPGLPSLLWKGVCALMGNPCCKGIFLNCNSKCKLWSWESPAI